MDIALEKSVYNRRKKTAFFCGDISQSGGTERVFSVIANGLAERGYPVFAISLRGGEDSFFPLNQNIKVYCVEGGRKKKGIPGNIHYLSAVIEREKPDFLIDVDIILGCYSYFLKKRFPKLHWIAWEHFNFYHHFRKNHLLRKLVRKAVARYADWLVVLTDEDKRCYERSLKLRCGISRIYNPLSYPCTSREEDSTAYRKKTEYPVIFAAGRLTRVKGFDLLIRSWGKLEKKYPQWKVIIAGEGEDRDKLEKKVKRAGLRNLRFAGKVSDMEKYYEGAALFVLPSRSEGFGMALTEAMHFSIPAVAYNCKAGPGEIIDDGVTGFLVKPGDIDGFSEKMERLMRDQTLRYEMGERAARSVRRFDREGILDEWESLLMKVSEGNV